MPNNDKFYRSLPIDVLESFADRTFGKRPPSDLRQIIKFIKPKDKVLEVGVGTGRIGVKLIKAGVNYFGIEKQGHFLNVFKNKIKTNHLNKFKYKLFNTSFEKFNKIKNFDVILFPWSVIGDFSKREQLKVLQKTHGLLSRNGLCILDNPSKNQEPNKYGSYSPTLFYYEDWIKVFAKIGFHHHSKIYKTKTGVERELTILKK